MRALLLSGSTAVSHTYKVKKKKTKKSRWWLKLGNFPTQQQQRRQERNRRNKLNELRWFIFWKTSDSSQCRRDINIITRLPEESHAKIDVIFPVADVLSAVLEQSHHSFTDDMEKETWRHTEKKGKH